jgi:hypothetical protein
MKPLWSLTVNLTARNLLISDTSINIIRFAKISEVAWAIIGMFCQPQSTSGATPLRRGFNNTGGKYKRKFDIYCLIFDIPSNADKFLA